MSQFSQILDALQEPFPSHEVEFKPGSLNKDKSKALALAYVDSRAYIQRLNRVCPDWQDEYQVINLPDRVVVLCRLTIAGVTRTGDGESLFVAEERVEENAVTSASAQAFKRACVKFGLGAYLYALPQVWCDYDAQKRKIIAPPVLPEWALPSEEQKIKATISAIELEKSLSGAEAKETTPPAASTTVVTFGKMKGKTLDDVWSMGKDGENWLRWCANTDGKGFDPKNDPSLIYIQRQARAFLQEKA